MIDLRVVLFQAIFLALTPSLLLAQAPSVASIREDAGSFFEAFESNGESLHSYDVVLTIETFFDSSGDTTPQLEAIIGRNKQVMRIVFDEPSNQFLFTSIGNWYLNKPDPDNPDARLESARERIQGFYFNDGDVVSRSYPHAIGRQEDVGLERYLSDFSVPSIPAIGLADGGHIGGQNKEFIQHLKYMATGATVSKMSTLPNNRVLVRCKQEMAETASDVSGLVLYSEFKFDLESMMPVSREVFGQIKKNPTRLLVSSGKYKWDMVQETYLPVDCSEEKPDSQIVDGKKHSYVKSRDITLHWIKVNEPIVEDVFSDKYFDDPVELMKSIESVLPQQEDSKSK